MKKITFYLLVMLVTTSLIVSTSFASGGKPPKEGEEIVITLFTQEPGAFPTINDAAEEIFSNEHPNARVETTVVGYGEFESTLAALIAAGDAPDMWFVEPGGPLMAQVRADTVTDLKPYLQANAGEWQNRLYSTPLDLEVTVEGSIYAIPISLNNLQLFYNEGLMEKHKLQIPETTDDLISIAKKIKDTGIVPISTGIADKWAGVDLFIVLVKQHEGGAELMARADIGKARWNEPIFIDTMKTMKALVDSGVVVEGATSMAWHEDALPFWIQGKCLMLWPGGNWMIQDIPEELRANSIWFPNIPGEQKALTGGIDHAYCISSTCENKDLAAEFLKIFSRQEMKELIFKLGVAPAGPLEEKVESDFPLADKVNMENEYAVPRRINTPEFYDAVSTAVQGIFSGDFDAEEAMNYVQEVSDQLFE